jgi:hypothetical protein
MSKEPITRRDAIKKAAYITPVILTVLAAPCFASAGSGVAAGSGKVKHKKDHKDKRDKRIKFKWKD